MGLERRDEHSRFHLLLSDVWPQRPDGTWVSQLQSLLEPQGVDAEVVHSGREVVDLAGTGDYHAAVIDLGLPVGLGEGCGGSRESDSGLWVLELLQRLPERPPVVVLRGPAQSRRQAERLLGEALRLGAFTVMEKPVKLDQVLNVFRRLVDRQYRGIWPGAPADSAESWSRVRKGRTTGREKKESEA